MAPDKAPQIQLLSHEPRHQALRGGLAILFRKSPVLKIPFDPGHNGDGNNHKAPQINILSHEPRRKVISAGISTLLRKYPTLPAALLHGSSGNGHKIPGFKLLSHEPRRHAIRGGFKSLFLKNPPPRPLIICRQEVGARGGPKFTAFFTSCLMHFSLVFFLLSVPFMYLLPRPADNIHLPQIVYEFHEIELPKDLPSVKPPGEG
ncbi:MAG TPA: hypothetical protein VFL79_05405, partial [Terriglobia bacterium]|nr:hypothetical protein [Terriglobia bacterium]